jgi:hypothetical protein
MSENEPALQETQRSRLPNGIAPAVGNTIPRAVRGGLYPENNPPPEQTVSHPSIDLLATWRDQTQVVIEIKTAPVFSAISASKFVRPSGPIKLFKRVTEDWGLDEGAAAKLLGFRDPRDVRDLFAGIRGLAQTQIDAVDRLRAVLRSAATLHNMYRDNAKVRQWLYEPKEVLGGEKPIDLLLRGPMRDLLRVHQYTEELAGR